MANNRVQVSLAFQADTKQAKQAINELYNNINKINTLQGLSIGDRLTKDMQGAIKTASQLQAALANATNADTGKLDLTKFNKSMQDAGMSIEKYRLALQELGPDGEKAFIQLTSAIQGAEIPLRRTGKLASELWTTLKNTMRWQISASVIQGFQGAVQKAYGYAQDLNESLNNIRIVTNASVEDMARFAVEANKSAKALSTTTTEYTNASLIYYQQGLSAAEVKERTDVTIKMANVARESAETISDQMTAVWNNFADGSKTLEYYADVMTALGAATASSTAEITTGLEKFAAVAETVGLSYEYATTALATITDTTRQSADVVGNALKTLFARIQGLSLGETLEDGTDLTKYSEALMKVGISIKEQDGSLRKMDDILDDMASKWQTLNKDQQVALAQTVAGVRQYTQLVALMDNWDKFQKNLSVAQGAEGALQKQSDIYAEGWEAARERVQASLESIYQELLNDKFFIALTNSVNGLIKLVDHLIDAFGGVSGVLTGISLVATKLFSRQIAGSIRNLTFNAKQALTGGANEIALKRQASHSLANWSTDGTMVGAARSDGYVQIDKIQQKMLNNATKLTEEEVKQNQLIIERQQKLNELNIAAAQEVDDAQARTEAAANNLNNSFIFGNELQNNPKYTEDNDEPQQIAVSKGVIQQQEIANLQEYSAALTIWKDAVKNTNNSAEDLDKIKKALNAAFPENTNIDKMTTDLAELETQLKDVEMQAKEASVKLKNLALEEAGVDVGFSLDSEGKETKPTIYEYLGITQQQWEEYQVADASYAKQLTQEFEAMFSEVDDAVNEYTGAKKDEIMKKVKQAITAGAAEANAQSQIDAQGMKDFADGLSGIASGASAVVFGLQALSGAWETLKNPDLTGWQKFFSVMMTVSTSLITVINGVKELKVSLDLLKNSNTINAVLKTLSQNSFLASKGIVTMDAATGKAVFSLSAFKTALMSAVPYLALLAAAVAAVVLIYQKMQEASPEAQLERATQASNDLSQALSDARVEAEALKSAIEGYDSAVAALEDCVEGTEQYEEALRKANEAALELLKNNPELYSQGEVKRLDNGLIDIDTSNIKQKDTTSFEIADVYGRTRLREQEIENLETKLRNTTTGADLYTADGRNWFDEIAKLAKETNGIFTKEDIANLDLGGYLTDDVLDSIMKNQPLFQEWIEAINANTLATEIENEELSKSLLNDKGYEKSVIAAAGKTLSKYTEEERNKLKDRDLNTYFEAFEKARGIDADWDQSTGTYTYKDSEGNEQTGQLSKDALLNWQASQNAAARLEQAASQINTIFRQSNSYGTLANGGINAISKVEMAKMDEKTLSEMVDLGLITQTVADEINAIPEEVAKSTLLEDTLSANLQQIFVNAFGKNWANEYAGNLIKQIPLELRDEFGAAVSQTNWSDVDSAQGFHDLLTELGGWMPENEVEGFVQQMMDANNAVKAFNSDAFKEEFYNLKDILGELEKGDTISPEDYAKLNEAEREYFTLTSDGTYMLTQDAKEFYDTVMGNRLDDAKEKITQLQGDINEFDKAYQEFQDYGGDADKLNNVQSASILLHAGVDITGMTNQEKIAEVKKLTEAYEDNKLKLNEVQAVLASMAEDETTLNKWLEEGRIDVEEYDKAMEVLRINQEKALKALNANVKGLEKSAPKIQKALEAMNKGLDIDSDTFINLMNEAIEAHPEFTGAIMSAYQTLLIATPGTIEYTNAFKELQQVLSETASSAILSDIGEVAESTLEVLDDELSSTSQKMNAIANLNAVIGTDIFSFEDIGTDKLQNLREALNGSESAFKELQTAVAEGILIKYNLGTGTIDVKELFTKGIEIQNLADDVREALIACGMFEIVDEIIEVPITNMDITKDIYNSMTQAQKDNMDIIDGGFERGGSVISGTKPVKVSFIKPVGDAGSLRSGPSKSGGSGSKGTKKVSSDEKERYHVVNKQIEDVTAKYEEAGKEREKAFGPLKDSWAEKELGYLDQLIEKERQYKAEIEQYLATDKSALAAYGATFGEHGEITNYDALMDEQIAKYNAAIEKAGTNQEKQEAAEKAYDLFIKALENYEGTYSAYLDKLATIQDLQNEKIDKELQNIQDKLDAKLDLEADQLTYLDYLIGKLDDEAFALADALVSLHDKTQPIMNQSDHYAQAWEELQRTAKENGGWTQDMIDKLRELRDGLISTNEEIMELQKTIEEKVNEAIAECTDELDKQINRFDTYQNILQNYNDIIDLSGKKFKDYAMMLELSSLMTDNAINKLASSREKLETLGQAQINAQAKLELAEDSGDQDVIDYWKKTLEDIQIEVENATAEMGSAWKEALQAASDAFESQVNLAIDNFKGGLEAFGDLDMISDSYDRAEKAAERYLEDFEKTHELSQLGRDITKAMNDTTSAFAKDELAELMAEVNEKQKDGVKMSEYDLEVLKKKFELKQAELALEEAQNSMSQVRLTRDNEGNWSYQYTADQDKVDEALNEYETRLYEVAKLSDEYIDEMSSAIIQNQKDMYEALAGLRAEDFASYEEYEAKVREIVNFYTTQDAYLRDELAKAVGDTETITTQMSAHYNNLSTSFTTVVDTMLGNTGDKTGNLKTWMESTDNLAEQAEEYFNTELPKAYEKWEESVADAMEAAGTNTEDFKDDVSGYMGDIGDASEELAEDIGDAADDMQDYIEDVMDAVWDWQEEYAAAIREMIAANEELIQSMMAVAAAQGAGDGDGDVSDYSLKIAELISQGATMDSEEVQKWLKKRANKTTQGGIYDEDNANIISNDQLEALMNKYVSGDEEAVALVDKVVKGQAWLTDDIVSKIVGFATGGYTGAWGPEGKIAMVHEKELVLNSDDTINFLAGVNILREIAKMIDLQAANMAMPHGFTLPMSTSSGGALEQNVHISASFPGVQDRNEIEIALRSLVNEASQFVLE